MADNEQIGLEAIFESEDFQKGIAEYNSAISDAVQTTEEAAGDIEFSFGMLGDEIENIFSGISSSVEASMLAVQDVVAEAAGVIEGEFSEMGDEVPQSTDTVNESIGSVGETTKETARVTEESSSGMTDAWGGLASAGTAIWAGLALAIAAVTAELLLAFDAAMDSEDVLERLEFQVGKTGAASGITTGQVLGLADSLSKVIPIDDEVIAQAATMGMTFDNVTKDNIEPLLKAAADLSFQTGKDLPAQMKTLALAIADPEKAVRLFKDANVTLTEAEEKQLKKLKETGDVLGAETFILDKVNEKFGGLAETMGDTTSGKIKILQTSLGNLQETLGTGLLDAGIGVVEMFSELASNPRLISFVQDLGLAVGDAASAFLRNLPDITQVVDTTLDTLEGIPAWLEENQPIIAGVLGAIAVTLAAFGISSAAALAPVIASALPIIAVIGAVGLAIGILYKAWTEDWGGIQGKFMDAWVQIEPVFTKFQEWLAVQLPVALQFLADIWNNVLLPAIQTVIGWWVDNILPLYVAEVLWLSETIPAALQVLADFWTNILWPAIVVVSEWINTNLVPIFTALQQWLAVNIPVALQALSSFWTGTLLPAITAVWAWINTNLIPLFMAISRLINTVVVVALRILGNIFTNTILPAVRSVWSFISTSLSPIFQEVGKIVKETVVPALEDLASFINDTLKGAFDGIASVIQGVIDIINTLIDTISNIALPPGIQSEGFGLEAINKELAKMASATIPAVKYQMEVLGSVRDVQGRGNSAFGGSISNSSQVTRNYLYGSRFEVSSHSSLIDLLNGMT